MLSESVICLLSFPLSFSFLFWASDFPSHLYVLLSCYHSIHVLFRGSGPHRPRYGRPMGIDFKKTTTGLKVAQWFQLGGKPKTLPDPHNPVILILSFFLFSFGSLVSLTSFQLRDFLHAAIIPFKACTTCLSNFSLLFSDLGESHRICHELVHVNITAKNKKRRNVLLFSFI